MLIRIDIDNTICYTNGMDYENAVPNTKNIIIANNLFNQGNEIVYWTSRGVGSGKDLYDMTKKQLDKWGCLYTALECNKPLYDIFIDDKALNNFDPLNDYKLNYVRNSIPKLDQFYKNKKVCLLGNGSSLENASIDFLKYDTVVGTNRIWKTKFAPNINVYYNSMSSSEKNNVLDMFQTVQKQKSFKFFVCCPWCSGPRLRAEVQNNIMQSRLRNHLYTKRLTRTLGEDHIKEKRPLTGITALFHIMMSNPELVDIYGFDFYETNYIEGLRRYRGHNRLHSLEANRSYLLKTIEESDGKIVWYQ